MFAASRFAEFTTSFKRDPLGVRAENAPPLAQGLRAAAWRLLRRLPILRADARHPTVDEAQRAGPLCAELPAGDPLELLRAAELADWTLLTLVVCAAAATLVLATATAVLA